MISSLIIALKGSKIKNINLLFFIIGGITCFVDFLTVPIITLGLPLIIYFLNLQKERNLSVKETFKIIVLASLSWLIGYGGVWVGKWILVDILYGKNIIKTAMEQVLFRSASDTSIYYKDAVHKNIYILGKNIAITMIFGFLGAIINFIKYRKNKINIEENIINSLPYCIIMIMPFVWYFVLRDHSYEHACFTYRTLVLTLIGFMLIFIKIAETENKNSEN